ncbi:uncharacterized protein V3H82_022220 [Fundulus diaphanus]
MFITYNMFLGFVLVFSLCTSTVKSISSIQPTPTQYPTTTITIADATLIKPVDLRLVATPDYPVAAGQQVQLRCITEPLSQTITWSRYNLQNESWENVGSGADLVLTEPNESGQYRCETRNVLKSVSQYHTVYIVYMPTMGERLGKAAFALSVLNMIAIIAGLLWLCWQQFGDQLSALNAPKKDLPAPPVVTPKVLPPLGDCDGDVYMNYTSDTQAYTDLNPSHVAGDGLYSTLS